MASGKPWDRRSSVGAEVIRPHFVKAWQWSLWQCHPRRHAEWRDIHVDEPHVYDLPTERGKWPVFVGGGADAAISVRLNNEHVPGGGLTEVAINHVGERVPHRKGAGALVQVASLVGGHSILFDEGTLALAGGPCQRGTS